jgi:formiminotetrahydrofolate cyclodeaminase
MAGEGATPTFTEPTAGTLWAALWSWLADPEGAPGGGSALAAAADLAAALVAKAARRSMGSWSEAGGAAAQAAALAARCSALAEEDAQTFAAALQALEERTEIESRLGESVDVLLALAETTADLTELAAWTAERCDGTFRGDAMCAALLAEAAACGAAVLVAGNLTVTSEDERVRRAKGLADRATRSVGRALESGS